MGDIEVVLPPPERDESSVEEEAPEDVTPRVGCAVSLIRAESDCDMDVVEDRVGFGDDCALRELSPEAVLESVLCEETEEEAEADEVDDAEGEP